MSPVVNIGVANETRAANALLSLLFLMLIASLLAAAADDC